MEKRCFKNAVQQSLIVYPKDYHLKKELDHFRYIFQKHNSNLTWIIRKVAKQVKNQNI